MWSRERHVMIWLAAVSCAPVEVPVVSTEPLQPLSITAELTLERSMIRPLETQVGRVTYRNPNSSALRAEKIVIAMRRPGATHAGGPYDDAFPQLGPIDVAPGETVEVVAGRAFGESDPIGLWEAYPTHLDAAGVWRDGKSVFFVVSTNPSEGDAGIEPQPDAGEPTADAGSPTDAGSPMDAGTLAPGYFHTEGSEIVDSNGTVARLTGINWFGFETSNFAPHGLWQRGMGSFLDQIAALGYNLIRVPFCNQMFDAGSAPNGIDFSANPDLVGKTSIEILDRLIDEAGARGLRIVLDRHRPTATAQSELWYTPEVPESRWISDWEMLAARYLGNTTVIGADLHNEPHGAATWGDGNMATDWRLAAQRAGNAILAINPDWLIIVEGVENAGGTYYWWGGNLSRAAEHPVVLDVPNRVVYSPHDYPASVYAQAWFSDPSYPSNLAAVWDQHWGHLKSSGTAPVWLGEFGTKYETDVDRLWLQTLATYLDERGISFAYWCLNPNSGDTGGILQDDWMTVNQDKQAVLDPILAPPL